MRDDFEREPCLLNRGIIVLRIIGGVPRLKVVALLTLPDQPQEPLRRLGNRNAPIDPPISLVALAAWGRENHSALALNVDAMPPAGDEWDRAILRVPKVPMLRSRRALGCE